MCIRTVGDDGKPVIVMLTGSFCQSASLAYLYESLKNDYYIILPEYNGHYVDSTFTTGQNEAKEIADYLQGCNITHIKMLYGQSMGAEITIELLRQLQATNITVDHCFLDGAPCTKLPPLIRKIMYLKFKSMIDMINKKDIDGGMNGSSLKKFFGGDTEGLQPMLKAFAQAAPLLTKETIKNETECCYTFDFPPFDAAVQKNMHFLYGSDEKAYKLCYNGVKRAYPMADYTIVNGYGHLIYSIKETDKYIEMLQTICKS